MGAIEVEGLCKAFGDKVIFADVSLDIPEGETTAIIGPSGTGKSVLLKHLVGLIPPDRGRVRVLGVDLTTASAGELAGVRKRMGLCFQAGALFDSLTVGENVAFPLVHHARHLSRSAQRARAEEKLALVGLEGFYDRAPSDLSGGQRKRVGIARAIAMEPEIVLFDEPNSGLDPLTSQAIDQLILDMKDQLGSTFVIISHDIVGTVSVADHIAMLHGGGLVAWGPTRQVVRSPVPVVRAFLARNLVLPSEPGAVAALPPVE